MLKKMIKAGIIFSTFTSANERPEPKGYGSEFLHAKQAKMYIEAQTKSGRLTSSEADQLIQNIDASLSKQKDCLYRFYSQPDPQFDCFEGYAEVFQAMNPRISGRL
jgi:hypothetical protein